MVDLLLCQKLVDFFLIESYANREVITKFGINNHPVVVNGEVIIC